MTKTVLITGASRGLGKELAHVFYFAKEKWNLILHYNRNEPHIDRCDRVQWWEYNIYDPFCLFDIFKDNQIDLLINNAGVYDYHLQNCIRVNFFFPVELMKVLLNKNSKMKVININSLAGLQSGAGEMSYGASKHALKGYCQALKQNHAEITDVFVGAMKTDMTKHRDDWNELINPYEVADIIYGLAESRQSSYIPEITIRRKN